MDLIKEIVSRAQANKQRIVLPEGTEERTLKAANQILTDEVADLILLGYYHRPGYQPEKRRICPIAFRIA